MWLSDASVSVSSANFWFAVSALFTTLGGVAIAVITVRGHSAPNHSEVSKAGDEAVAEYRETFVEPLRKDRDHERERRIAAEAEADGYRRKWDACERQRIRERRDDRPS